MGQTNWTSEQREIIDARNENILVSAAAGSGKTTVLVERIFQRMTDPVNPVGIDRFVVVTFTNLAAAQMKDRLRRRIDEELAAHPDNEYLARQSVLVSQAHICTVHSFCGFVIKNYFHRIGLDPAYRQGNEAELKNVEKRMCWKIFWKRNMKRNSRILWNWRLWIFLIKTIRGWRI